MGVDMMRLAIVSVLVLFGTIPSASADVVDDYFACMVGKAAVAMNKQPGRKADPEKAKAIAASLCPRPKAADREANLDKGLDLILKAIADAMDQQPR